MASASEPGNDHKTQQNDQTIQEDVPVAGY